MRPQRLIIIGSGGHAGVVIESVGKEAVFGLVDVTRKVGDIVHGRTVITVPVTLKGFLVHVAVGDIKFREDRCALFFDFLVEIIHPTAVVMTSAIILKGSYIAAKAVICNRAAIGSGVIVNTGASIDHDCVIGDYCNIGPGAVICGGVHIGKRSLIGAGAIIREKVSIGENSTIGMGSVVLEDVPPNVVTFGNPCQWVRPCA